MSSGKFNISTSIDTKTLLNSELSPPRRKNLREAMTEMYYEYCSNTAVHCVQYLGAGRPWKEVCFWICIFTISIFFGAKTISKIFERWNETPVIVSFSERSTPVSDIPFPAITICSETRSKRKNDGK